MDVAAGSPLVSVTISVMPSAAVSAVMPSGVDDGIGAGRTGGRRVEADNARPAKPTVSIQRHVEVGIVTVWHGAPRP